MSKNQQAHEPLVDLTPKTDGADHVILVVQRGGTATAHKADWVKQVEKLRSYLCHHEWCAVWKHSEILMSAKRDRPECTCGLDGLLTEIPGLLRVG